MTRMVLVGLQDWYPPLGLGYIASYLNKYGNFKDIRIVLANQPSKILENLQTISPDIVGISSLTFDYDKALLLAKEIKYSLGVPIILGGNHISALPHTLAKPFDIAVLGEGESTMLELMRLFEKDGLGDVNKLCRIKGIAFHASGKVHITDKRPPIEPLDTIPLPARGLFDKKHFLTPRMVFGSFGRRVSFMISSRGCPYNCVFCASAKFWGKHQRFFTPSYVVAEIRELMDRYKAEVIYVYDDLFITNIKRIKEIVKLINEEKINEKIEFGCFARANLINDEVCKLLKQMNLKEVILGLESMSDNVLGYLKRNSVTVRQNRTAVKLCKKYGILTGCAFMIGSPVESFEDALKTLDFIGAEDGISSFNIYATTPYPGTDLWEYAIKKGVVKDDMDWSRLDILLKSNSTDNFLIADKLSQEELLKLIRISTQMIDSAMYTGLDLSLKHIGRILRYIVTNPKSALIATFKRTYYAMLNFFRSKRTA